MIHRGDSVYLWYWGAGDEPTAWKGPFPSGDQAMAAARSAALADGFTIVDADRIVPTIEGIFDAQDILGRFYGNTNYDIWATEPADIILTGIEKAELELKLKDCLHRWLRKHCLDDKTKLHTIRARDYFGPAVAS